MRSVLVIMNNFAPENNCASIPNTKLIKYLARNDCSITLITKKITPSMNLDENLLPPEIKKIHVIRVGQSTWYEKTIGTYREKITKNGIKLKMKAERRPFRAKIVAIIQQTFFFIRSNDWINNVQKTIKKELKNKTFDCVYSSYPEIETHHIANYIKKKGIAQYWIADFRDPVYYEVYNRYNYNKNKKIQHNFEKKADHITIVSEDVLGKFLFNDIPKDKITYLPNGFDPEDFNSLVVPPNNTNNYFRIFYAGTLYAGKRDFSILFRALSELDAEKLIDISKVNIEYAGNEWLIMLSFAKKYNMENNCINYGYITRQQVLEILSTVDCSAVCTHNTKLDKGIVTGKLFELLLMNKPIIAVVNGNEPNSELGKIIRQCSAGIVYEEASHEKDYLTFKNWLKNAYIEKINTGIVTSELIIEERDRYSYDNIACDLFNLMK